MNNKTSVSDDASQTLIEPFQAVLGRFGGNATLLATVSKKFASEMDIQMQALQKSIELADRDDVRKALHTLKGVAATVGAQLLSCEFAQFEMLLIKDVDIAPEQVVGQEQYQYLLELISRSDVGLQALLIDNGIELD